VDPDLYLGREVAGYQVEEIIGRGGMGVVYRAEHLRLGRKVALKVVAPQIAREPKFRERFLRESRTAGSLDHPNVVPIYDAGEADGVLYIAMRFVDGVDLATLITRDGKLEAARTARIVAQVASALDAAHEAGLVHRDVKPSNVLLPARGAGRGEHAYLGDFGLTKRVLSESGVTGSSAFLGTIAYVAPEQIEGRAVDAKADQYSLACLVYECLTGRRPFERETDVATLYAHLRDPFPSVGDAVDPNLEFGLDAALARAAAKKPADRFASCGDFAEELVRVTGATPGTSQVPTAVGRGQAAARTRRRLLLVVGAAVAVAALAIAGLVVWLGGSPPPVVLGNGVATINVATNQPALAADLPMEPRAIAADATAAWVTHFADGRVSRIDAAAPHGVTPITVGAGPGALVAANGLVWVANTTAETLSEIDSENYDRAPTTLALLFRPGAVALGDEFLWVIDTQSDSVTQIDAGSLAQVNDPVSVGAEPVAVAAGNGVVWVANSLDQSLSRLTVGLGSADAPIPLGFTPGALAIDVETNALWIVDRAGDRVVRYGLSTRRETAEVSLPTGSRPAAIAVGGGAVWVANAGDGTVSRIDPETNAVVATITIGGTPVGIAFGGETVWVAVAER
jgi:YVTN family beta-propeller protein